MGPQYRPAPGIVRFLAGTPAIIGVDAVQAGAVELAAAGIEPLRAKSIALTELAITLHDERLAPLGFALGTPREPARRGSHVSFRHPDAWRICQALIEHAHVIPDFRGPDVIRLRAAAALHPLRRRLGRGRPAGRAGRAGGAPVLRCPPCPCYLGLGGLGEGGVERPDLGRRHRTAEEEALAERAALLDQPAPLGLASRCPRPAPAGPGRRRAGSWSTPAPRHSVVRQVGDERAVDLERGHGHLVQAAERGVAGAEVVDRQPQAALVQLGDDRLVVRCAPSWPTRSARPSCGRARARTTRSWPAPGASRSAARTPAAG